MGSMVAAGHALRRSFRVRRHLSFFRHLRILHSPLLGKSARRRHSRTCDQLLHLLETTRAPLVSTILRRARDLPLLHRIQNPRPRHRCLLVGRPAAPLHAAQPRPADHLHDQRRVLDARDRRATVPRLLPAALPADSLRLDQDVAVDLFRASRLADHGPRFQQLARHQHSRHRSRRDELVHLGVRRSECRGSVRTSQTSRLVLQTLNCRTGTRLRCGYRATITESGSNRRDTRYWLALDAPGVGRRVLHTRKLCGHERAALAPTSFTRAAPDSLTGISRSDLILTLPDAFVRADALVLVRFHKATHPHHLVTDPNTAVRRVCVAVLPRV